MPGFEYKVVPAPTKGTKAKGVKTPEGRFAHMVETLMNELAVDGWEYLRADMLPSEERQGLTGSTTNWRNILIFRREIAEDKAAEPVPELAAPDTPSDETARKSPPPLRLSSGAERILKDNGVEEISDVAGMTEALKARAAATKASD